MAIAIIVEEKELLFVACFFLLVACSLVLVACCLPLLLQLVVVAVVAVVVVVVVVVAVAVVVARWWRQEFYRQILSWTCIGSVPPPETFTLGYSGTNGTLPSLLLSGLPFSGLRSHGRSCKHAVWFGTDHRNPKSFKCFDVAALKVVRWKPASQSFQIILSQKDILFELAYPTMSCLIWMAPEYLKYLRYYCLILSYHTLPYNMVQSYLLWNQKMIKVRWNRYVIQIWCC